jgi:C1A family cysteine protease
MTKEHEYLVFEAYTLIADKLDFSFDKVCDETSLLNNETPIELIIIVRNAELELNKVHISTDQLNKNEMTDFAQIKQESKKEVEKVKSFKINHNNSLKNKTWMAAPSELALLSFEKKRKFYQDNLGYITGGLEYYYDGIFSTEDFNPVQTTLKSALSTSCLNEIDWRNRHGQNWITPIKNQTYDCGSCYAFATVAVLEAMMNIYYNNSILNLDLSEQEIVSCSLTNSGCSGGTIEKSLSYIYTNSIVPEECFPYTASNDTCINKCQNPSETFTYSPANTPGTTIIDRIIYALRKGPVGSGFWGHAMAVVGYKEVTIGDIIRIYQGNTMTEDTIVSGDPLIGQTYLIFKNSYGPNYGANGGYIYAIADGLESPDAITNPRGTTTRVVNCTDSDNDGYYFWGTGPKPSNCPYCSSDEPDWDDSNPTIGPLGDYGMCVELTAPYTFPKLQITNTVIWQNNQTRCGDVIVKSNGNLTINGANTTMQNYSEFSVETGGTLTFNSGTIQVQ